MPTFEFEARDRSGQRLRGRMQADNSDMVMAVLREQQAVPLSIKPYQVDSNTSRWMAPKKVKLTDLIFFCKQMHTLLKAGVPILEALSSLREANKNSALFPVIVQLQQKLHSGSELSKAMREQPRIFSNLFISLVDLGENSGNLAETFQQMSVYLEQERKTREQISSAVRYPIFVLSTMAVALIVINVMVIPAFAKFFKKYEAQLPLATRVLMASSEITKHYWPHGLVGVGLGVYLLRRRLATQDGRKQWDRLKMRLPVVGTLLFHATMGRFARTLALSLRAGVPWNRAMTLLSQTVNNKYIEDYIVKMRERVESGDGISASAATTGLFPPMVLQMLEVGEKSGALDTLSMEVAEYYEREVEYGLKTISSAIEPILTIGIGILVLVVAIGVFLPMWSVANAALHR